MTLPIDTEDHFLHPFREGFGRMVEAFRNAITPDTPAMASWLSRPMRDTVINVPSRMIDDVNAQIEKYRQVSNTRGNQPATAANTAAVPVMLVAFDSAVNPMMGDWGQQAFDPQAVILSQDEKERVFRLRLLSGQLRAQVVFISPDAYTSGALSLWFAGWLQQLANRRFKAPFNLAGKPYDFPQALTDPDIVPVKWPGSTPAATVFYMDFNYITNVPVLVTPQGSEPHDGKGTDGDKSDPHGFRLPSEFVLNSDGRLGKK